MKVKTELRDSLKTFNTNLEKLVSSLNSYRPGIVFNEIAFITLTNNGYFDFTKNLIKSLELSNTKQLLQCYCLDKECYEKITDISKTNKSVVAYLIDGQEKYKDFHKYRQGNWHEVVINKFKIIYENLCKYKYVLITDGDIVFEKGNKVFEYLNDIKDNYELIIQEEWGFSCCCSGFMMFRSTDNILKIVNPKNVKINRGSGDQNIINNNLKKMKHFKLPPELFPNGKYFYNHNKQNNKQKKDPYLIHFNCVVGMEKKNRMIKYDKWYN